MRVFVFFSDDDMVETIDFLEESVEIILYVIYFDQIL